MNAFQIVINLEQLKLKPQNLFANDNKCILNLPLNESQSIIVCIKDFKVIKKIKTKEKVTLEQ